MCYMTLVFPSSTMILNIFCGHLEFYPWTCALLMLSAYLSWRCIHDGISSFWPSLAMALAAAFHTSAVFYFPALLFLPILISQQGNGETLFERDNRLRILGFFALFILVSLLHRTWWAYFTALVVVVPLVYWGAPNWIRCYSKEWWWMFLPWFLLYTGRAYFELRAEPLFEHLPPLGEPYDHGAYLYVAFSWEHLYDKTLFHLWLAPFGIITLLYFGVRKFSEVKKDAWLIFLLNFSLWTLLWSTLFYPQLRTRDWDLFATIAVPLNLFALYSITRFLQPQWYRRLIPILILAQLGNTVPAVIANSGILTHRGYVTLRYEPTPVSCRAFLRGLELGNTPLTQQNARAGKAEVRLIPHERGYASWSQALELQPGREYLFDPVLKHESVTSRGEESHPAEP